MIEKKIDSTGKLFAVFSKRMAEALITQGFKLIKKLPNTKYQQFDVYYFDKTVEFELAFKNQQAKTTKVKSDI